MLIPHIEGDARLIRHKHPDKVNGHFKVHPTHVILVGNGAVDGGTGPLLKALEDATKKKVSDIAAASIAAVLAQGYKRRKYFALKDISEILANVESIDEYLADYYSFKSSLSQHYSQSHKGGELKLRRSAALDSIIDCVPSNNIGVVTTNWDPCLWEESGYDNVIQLHGLAGEPDSIILPGEFASDEDQIAEILDEQGYIIKDDNIRLQVQRMFRGEYRRPLPAALQAAESWLEGASTIVVWGLALHPYDSEICQLAWDVAGNFKDEKQLIVINPSERDREVCKFLFSSPKVQVAEFVS